MKVYLNLTESPASGGMFRVWAGLRDFLPAYGIEFVDNPFEADVYHAHINLYEKIPVNMPLVVSSHGMLWDSIWGGAWGTNRHLIDSYMQADIVTAPSQFVADAISRNTLIDARVVHHGIDTDVWVPGKNLGYVLWNKARVDPANDPDVVNRLAEMAVSVPFKTTFGNKAVNVDVIGHVEPDQMLPLVQNAAVYFDTAYESGGPCFGLLEAMACGVPALAWNSGGNSEAIIHKETGYLAEPGNYADLYEGLNYCLHNRYTLGAAARQLAIEKYQWQHVVAGYIDAYNAAIAAHEHTVKVSVVIPCYNLGRFLPNCIDSLTTQSFTDWEAIIIDDASTDDSYEVAQRLTQRDWRFKLIHNDENQHVSETRNIGVLNSSGQYILPLDADDRLAPDALSNLVRVLDSKRDVHIVAGNLLVHDENNLNSGYNGGWPNNADPKLQLDGYNRLPYASMYRRHVWDRIGGYRRRIRTGIEDADFWTRALSYGYKAEIIPEITLLYTQRANSLRTANPYGANAWLVWFPWTKDRSKTPFGSTAIGPQRVDYIKPKVSVVIPVGPGHAHHIQGCLDSLLSQTYLDWEAVVVNDTGQRWFDDDGNHLTHYTLGFPFVNFVDTDRSTGVAHARNLGVHAASTDLIVFLDVDDTAQPLMLDVLMKSHTLVDGWIYGDWFTFDGVNTALSHAPNWSIDGILRQSLAPITGIYEREHILGVGGFDEKAPGWEDWEMQLRLLEHGICGTCVAFPLITYNMHLGARREDNFTQRKDLVQYIVDRHPLLYKKGKDVACRTCGGHKTLNVQSAETQAATNDAYVLMKYSGPEVNVRLFKSPTDRTRPPYAVSNAEPFYVHPADVDHFLRRVGFSVVQGASTETPASTIDVVSNERPLVSQAPARVAPVAMAKLDWDKLDLRPEIITILKENFATPDEITRVNDMTLLSLKGIGEGRLSAIRKALVNA